MQRRVEARLSQRQFVQNNDIIFFLMTSELNMRATAGADYLWELVLAVRRHHFFIHHRHKKCTATMLQEEAPFSFSLWCRSIGLTPFEQATARALIRQVTPPDIVEEVLVPSFDSNERKASLLTSTCNLTATMIGGSIISMPLAFEKCGVVLATLLVVFAAVITDVSLKLLCKCARQSGVDTYAAVGRVAFGPFMEYTISGILFILLYFVLVASMVLANDIWTPLIALWIPTIRSYQVLLGILLLASPFLVQTTLCSLRYLCYLSILAMTVVCGILCHVAYETFSGLRQLEYVTTSLNEPLVAFPIIALSFLSSFNVLHIQSTLIQPTNARIHGVIGSSVGLCCILTYLVGVCGYLYAGSTTRGNILLNLDGLHGIFVVGRICCGIVMICSMAVVMLPCRNAMLEFIESLHSEGACPEGADCEKEGETEHSSRNGSGVDLYVVHEGTFLLPSIEEDEQECFMIGNPYAHYGSTVLIMAFAFLGAIKAPSLAIVWSFCGPFLTFLISFFLPAACYLEIQRREPSSSDRVVLSLVAWFLIICSVVGAVACTVQTICISFDLSIAGDKHLHHFSCAEQQTILWLPCSP